MTAADHVSTNDIPRREWRQLGRLALESAIVGLFVSLVLALAVFVVSFEAQADDRGDARPPRHLVRDDGGGRTIVQPRFDDTPADTGRTSSGESPEPDFAHDVEGSGWSQPVWRQPAPEWNPSGVMEC